MVSSSSCLCRLPPPPSPQVCDIQVLVGKPKLFFIEACRGKENNFSTTLMSKASCTPQQCGITLPRFGKTSQGTRLGRAMPIYSLTSVSHDCMHTMIILGN